MEAEAEGSKVRDAILSRTLFGWDLPGRYLVRGMETPGAPVFHVLCGTSFIPLEPR